MTTTATARAPARFSATAADWALAPSSVSSSSRTPAPSPPGANPAPSSGGPGVAAGPGVRAHPGQRCGPASPERSGPARPGRRHHAGVACRAMPAAARPVARGRAGTPAAGGAGASLARLRDGRFVEPQTGAGFLDRIRHGRHRARAAAPERLGVQLAPRHSPGRRAPTPGSPGATRPGTAAAAHARRSQPPSADVERAAADARPAAMLGGDTDRPRPRSRPTAACRRPDGWPPQGDGGSGEVGKGRTAP